MEGAKPIQFLKRLLNAQTKDAPCLSSKAMPPARSRRRDPKGGSWSSPKARDLRGADALAAPMVASSSDCHSCCAISVSSDNTVSILRLGHQVILEPFKVVAMKDRKPAARAFADFLFRERRARMLRHRN
jgi:hypothetical protein